LDYYFEWDREKAKTNEVKHGVSFEEAASIFLDPNAVSIFDTSHSQAEDRWLTLGISNLGRILVLCHTFDDETKDRVSIRIISSRKAGQREIKQYRKD
jgi:uncharacterized DUF497 family protein